MNPKKRTIFTGFSPNLTAGNVIEALSFLLLPWEWLHWRNGKATKRVEGDLARFLHIPNVISYDSGRTSLYAALKALGVQKDDEVLVQAYTCMVVINAIRWLGATPIYVDIDKQYNMDTSKIEARISPKTKAIIIQHTFGTPADIDAIVSLAKKHKLYTIEDCAHSLGSRYHNKQTGSFADIAIYSFGSDKVISCARGGAAACHDETLAKRLREFQQSLPPSSLLKIFQHLIHYPIFYIGKKLYHIHIGKWLLAAAKKFSIINKIIYPPEKKGILVPWYPSQLPNALATMLLQQLSEITQMNEHRKEIARYYDKHLHISSPIKGNIHSIYLRYPLSVDNPTMYHAKAKQEGILLGNWYDSVIAPKDIDTEKTLYTAGSCPMAEQLSAQSINLPTNRNMSLTDAKRIVELVNSIYDRSKTNP